MQTGSILMGPSQILLPITQVVTTLFAVGGGDRGTTLPPTGPLLMNPADDTAPVKLFALLRPFTNRRLSDQEWSHWCTLLDCWTQGFSQWSCDRSNQSHQSIPTPQAAWARRQQHRRTNNQQPNPQQSRNPPRGCKSFRSKDFSAK